MKKIIFLILVFLLSVSIAVSIPQFLLFQGNVRIDNRDIATDVRFSIQGDELASSGVNNGEYSVMIQDYPAYYNDSIDITVNGHEAEQKINYVHPQDINLDLTTFTGDALDITSYSPVEDEIIVTEAGSVNFNVITESGYDDEINYGWYLNGVKLVADEYSHIQPIDSGAVGIHKIKVVVDDTFLSQEKEWTLIIGKPIVDDFDGDTTNFLDIALDELDSVEDVIFEKSDNGKIEFLENLNLVGVYDIENTVKIENGIVAVDTSTYEQFKEPARITLRNLNYNSMPIIYYNEGFTLTNINKECDFCEIISYTDFPTTNGEVVFEVEHFSSFKVGESGIKYDLSLFTELDTCEIKGNLDVKIKEPDNNDDFKFGEQIEIEAEVENNNEEELDIIVEAVLYNIDEDDEVEKIESKDIEINDNDDEIFELKLEVPKNFDEDNNYILFVKAYEDDNEINQCNYDLIDLDLEKEKYDVIIKEMRIMPKNIPKGGSFRALVEIENIGRKDIEDIYIKIKNEELGICLETDKFELKDGKETIKSFNVIIPEDINEKDYNLKAFVYFDDEEVSKEGKLSVEKEVKIKRKYVSEEVIPFININIIAKDVLKEFIENIPEIPNYIHIILFLIVVLLALTLIYIA